MKKLTNKYITMLIGVLLTMLCFSSCADQDDIEINYNIKITVGASHIFKTFQGVFDDDFDMDSYDVNWQLGLHLFIYNEDGVLVDSSECSDNVLSYKLAHELKLSPGNYKLVAVAEFHMPEGNGDDFWSISGKDNLKDLKITESSTILSVAQGTLGLYTDKLIVTNTPQNLDIDIPAITALLVNQTWLGDYIFTGSKGFSVFAPYVQSTVIYSENLSQSVSFDDINPIFDNGNIGYRYVINNTKPNSQYLLGMYPAMSGYRALLPQNNQSLYWQLTFTTNGGQQFGYTNDILRSNNTSLINIESGKQYYTDLVLDIMTLTFGEYNPSIDDQVRVQKLIEQYKSNPKIEGAAQIDVNSTALNPDDDENYTTENISEVLSLNFDTWIGLSESDIKRKLEGFSLFYEKENMTTYYGKGLISLITIKYLDSTKSEVIRVMLTWNMENKSQYDKVSNYMKTKYTFLRDQDGYIQFLNSPDFSTATCGMTWDSSNYCMYFDSLKY